MSTNPFAPGAIPTTSGGGSGGTAGGASGSKVPSTAAGAVAAQQGASGSGTSHASGGSQAETIPAWSWQGIQRSIFGSLLGTGGEEGAVASTKGFPGKGGAKPVRVLTPHAMQQTPGGKYSVVVWRKNKQVGWRLGVGYRQLSVGGGGGRLSCGG